MVEPARFRLPVGAAPFQAMIIHVSEVGENRNNSRAFYRLFPWFCELLMCHVMPVDIFLDKRK